MFSFVFVSALVHELYRKLSNVIENVAFVVFDVYSMKPVLSSQTV